MFDYNPLLNQALAEIQNIRKPQAIRLEYIQRSKQNIDSNRIVSLGGFGFQEYKSTAEAANEVIGETIKMILYSLWKEYGVDMDFMNVSKNDEGIRFAIIDKANSRLLVIKNPEKDLGWRLSTPIKTVENMMKYANTKNFKLVYLLYDNAKDQVYGGEENDTICSIKWLFETYLSIDEYETFHRCFSNFMQCVNYFLGFTVSKTLNSTSQVNFRRVVMNRIAGYDYSVQKNVIMNKGEQGERNLSDENYDKIYEQYIKDRAYLILLGEKDFAESFVTAEWMYDTMREVHSIDLTPIALGYLKFAEQILYSYLYIHKDDDLQQKQNDRSFKRIDVEKLENDSSGTTLGPMAHIYKDNLKILRADLPFKTRKYFVDAIFAYKDIRNGYVHKDNICNWETIERIRDETYRLAFLFLGTAAVTDDTKHRLGYPEGEFTSDHYKLCEYVDYHAGDLFYLCYEPGKELIVTAVRDQKAKPMGKLLFQYSGAYFSLNGSLPRNIFDDMPRKIFLGSLGIADTETVSFNPRKERLIFENGKYVGPNIYDEPGIHY